MSARRTSAPVTPFRSEQVFLFLEKGPCRGRAGGVMLWEYSTVGPRLAVPVSFAPALRFGDRRCASCCGGSVSGRQGRPGREGLGPWWCVCVGGGRCGAVHTSAASCPPSCPASPWARACGTDTGHRAGWDGAGLVGRGQGGAESRVATLQVRSVLQQFRADANAGRSSSGPL